VGIKDKIKKKIYNYYFKKGLRKALDDLIKEPDIPKILSDIDKTILSLKEEVDTFSKALDLVETKYGKNEEAAEVSTIFPFLNLSMLDILILHKQYLNTKDSIEKNFICRTAAQHMYEFLEDGSKALGKQMNYYTDKLNDTEINLEIKVLRKSFNELKAELHTPLKELRHNVSGHKDRNIRQQLAISNGINIIEFQKNFILFMLFFLKLTLFKKKLVGKIEKQKAA
jgi:hypothetical protein